VAVLGSILASRFRVGVGPAVHALPAAARAASGSLGGALSTADTLSPSARSALGSSARLAYVDALNVTLLVAVAGILMAAFLVAYLLRSAPDLLAKSADPALEAA
jgi:MFS transporter, DHA2 family, multidrug resistance protein